MSRVEQKIKIDPESIFKEYEAGVTYKTSIGDLGIYEQAKINERHFIGDQWYGAMCGNKRPLVRQNMIKRIGEYKMSAIGSAPVAVNYSAEGVPNTNDIRKKAKEMQTNILSGDASFEGATPDNVEISVITDAMSKYRKITAERVKFDLKAEEALRNAFISGTGIAYTYWDNDIETGLYADEGKTTKIKGDIDFEILDVENVNFGDPNNDDVQSQPYITISQRLNVEAVRREAKRNHQNADDIEPNNNDGTYNSGTRGEQEPTDNRRVTVLTKLYKEYDENGNYKVMAVKVTEKATVRKAWDTGLTMYPIAVFCWERRRSCIYGDSEVTYLIPNQVAINRMASAAVDSAIKVGMPKMIVNADLIPDSVQVTNEPGQIIRVYGDMQDVSGALGYVAPPYFASQYQTLIDTIMSNSLSMAGANDAALGDIRPDNAAAIMQMREAALQPMQIYQNRYYGFIEEISRIWVDFWINKYGKRNLKVETANGIEYIPFDADRYKNLVFTANVDVGASTLWGEGVVVSRLDGLLQSQIITPEQYLERMPQGLIPRLHELIEDLRQKREVAEESQGGKDEILKQFAEQYPEEFAKYSELPPEEQELMLNQIMGGGNQ